jgi:hypothetical protein
VTPLTASSSEDVDTSFWRSMIDGWLKHKEGEVHHIREDVRNIKDMMTSLLSFSIHHPRRLYHNHLMFSPFLFFHSMFVVVFISLL